MNSKQEQSAHPTASRDRLMIDLSLLILRLAGGGIMFAHGAQKTFGWWGGAGLTETAKKMDMGVIGYLVSIGECFGGAGIVLGFLTRFSAASNVVIMIGAIAKVHGKNGFFMSDGGYEYNLALIGLLLPIVLVGPGRFAVGRFLPLPRSKKTGAPLLPLE